VTATRYVVEEDRTGARGYVPRGAALDLWRYKGSEVIIAGPAETGKTRAALEKLDALLIKYRGAQAVVVRKVRDTIHSTCLQTYLHKVLRSDGHGGYAGVKVYGGEKPQWFDYANGSRLWLAGIDDPGKALSSERDFVYVNQAEELTHDDWQVLTTRTTGRAGHSPYGQVFGDCNPGPAHHWIKNRIGLKVLESRHEDNPVLWDEARQDWTAQGRRTLAVLDGLTGVRKERLRYGRWVSAEGTVYEFDARLHLLDPFPITPTWPRLRVFDFGYTNPFVCSWFALDPDGRLYLYREWYMTRRTVRVHAERVKELSGDERYEADVADHDAEDRATLAECGIHTSAADKALTPGIQAVQNRMQRAGDGRPRLFVMRGCLVERDEALAEARLPVCTEQEFDAYVWPKGSDGKAIKEVPVDKDNHGMDNVRYAVRWADRRQRGGAGIHLPDPLQKTLTGPLPTRF
jgi:hypothetical protein